MMEFVVARNPDGDSSLPFPIRLPIGDGVGLKARDAWPRTAKIYCHRADHWPDELEIVERVQARSCVRHGAAIDLVLDRGREPFTVRVHGCTRSGSDLLAVGSGDGAVAGNLTKFPVGRDGPPMLRFEPMTTSEEIAERLPAFL